MLPTNKNRWIADIHNNSEEYQSYHANQNQARHKRVQTVWGHLHEI